MLITVEEAWQRLTQLPLLLRVENKRVERASGQVLAKHVCSPIDMPPFAQSAMDGYALGTGGGTQGSIYRIVGEAAAGSAAQFQLGEHECVRIFTGAPVPGSAVAVVQQEWVQRTDDGCIVLKEDVPTNMHIRQKGEQMQRDDEALPKGTRLTPAAIGFLQMLGVTHVDVYARPTLQVLVTGNELVEPGGALQFGQIYESNGQMLLAAAALEGVEASICRVRDDLEQTQLRIGNALRQHDMVVVSGGISVGDHDHVSTALNRLGVEQLYYKVLQKPGKPIYVGIWHNKVVFALPGNPAASLTCFYEHVLPVLRRFMGRADIFLHRIQLPLADGSIRSLPRAQFLKAWVGQGQVHMLEGQSSAMLNTFARANALIYVPANTPEMRIGDSVTVHLLP